MLRRFALILFAILLTGACIQAGTLEKVRFNDSYGNRMRLVLDLEGLVYYGVLEDENSLTIALLSCEASASIPNTMDLKDWALSYCKIFREDKNIYVSFPREYPVSYQISALGSPSRLVIDFDKAFTKIARSTQLADGLEYFSVVKRGSAGLVTAKVLKASPQKIDIFPALAEPQGGMWDWFTQFFGQPIKKDIAFTKGTVQDMVRQQGALSGINGTYFSGGGRPLGVLVVDGEIVSCPINDRTALILTDKNRALIDNIAFEGYFLKDKKKYSITSVNEPHASRKDVVLYTRRYGGLTGSTAKGYELKVEKGKIIDTKLGNSLIPENGYILSVGESLAEFLSQKVAPGDKIETVLNLIPYTAALKKGEEVVHVIGGGPRLVRAGQVYISKYEEKFKKDIAQGRAARTAAGVTADGDLLFVTVDGLPRNKDNRSSNSSIGMSLTELAYFMSSLGVKDAINFDGGGSTSMIVKDEVVNRPVDGALRQVSNAILFKPHQ